MKNATKRSFFFIVLVFIISTTLSFSFVCNDSDGDGYYDKDGCGTARDCNDADSSIYPGAAETCNGYDDNCDGNLDEGCDTSCDEPGNVGSDVNVTDTGFSSYAPILVWTGHEYGLAWEDHRDGYPEIYFARLDPLGSKIGSDVRVTYDDSNSFSPSLIWTGSEFGVAWEDHRDGFPEIYFARLDASGNKIGADVRVTYDESGSFSPSLVWTGNKYGLAWEDHRNDLPAIYFAILDSSGNKISSDIRVTESGSHSESPSLIWTGIKFAVTWADMRNENWEIYFARLDAYGNKIGSDVRVTAASGTSYNPSLAWSGSEYAVSWEDDRDGNKEIYFARLDFSGDKIGADVRVTAHSLDSIEPCIVWTGSEYGIFWQDQRTESNEIYFARIDAAGNKIDPDDFRMTTYNESSQDPTAVWTGYEFGVAWRFELYGLYGSSEIYFGRVVSCDDADSDGFTECTGDCDDHDFYVNPGEEEICDEIDNNCDGTVDEGCGGPPDDWQKNGGDQPVSSDDFEDSFYSSMDWNGVEYGIVWEDNRHSSATLADNTEIYFARVDSEGTRIGDEVRITSFDSSSSRPEIAWAGDRYGVTWFDDRDGNEEIYFALIDSFGGRLSADIRITLSSGESSQPSIVWDGSAFGIAWQDNRDYSQPSDYFEIYFARVDSSGTKIVQDSRITSIESIKGDPSIGFDGTDYGIAWEDDRDGDFEIYYARVNVSGIKQGSDIRITFADGDSVNPDIEWNGERYGLVWQDDRLKEMSFQIGDDDIYYNDIDSIGDKDGDDVLITNNTSNSANPNVAWGGRRSLLAVTGDWGVTFADDRDGNWEIYFTILNMDGTEKTDEARMTDALNISDYPTIVWSGQDFGISWQDLRNDVSYEVYFALISNCQDDDGDGYTQCEGDCDNNDINIHPGATDACDGVDNNCDGTVDDGDADIDSVSNCLDNCPSDYNPGQEDMDGDGFGDICDTCPLISNPGQEPDTTDPVLTVPPDVAEGCTGIDGTPVDIGMASATDNCCSAETIIITNDAPPLFPLGDTVVTWTATDCNGNSSTGTQLVTVADNVPPQISVSLTPNRLWPPNHRMVDISATVDASDNCSALLIVLDTILSDEDDDAPGRKDGNTQNDIQDADYGTPDYAFKLRAERNGGGDGRTYTVWYTATDSFGNESSASSVVNVQHDEGGETDPLDVETREGINGTYLTWGRVEGALHYNILRGSIHNIQETESAIDLGPVMCIELRSRDLSTQGWEDTEAPEVGEVFFYLVEYDDGSRSSYGTESAPKPRVVTAQGCE